MLDNVKRASAQQFRVPNTIVHSTVSESPTGPRECTNPHTNSTHPTPLQSSPGLPAAPPLSTTPAPCHRDSPSQTSPPRSARCSTPYTLYPSIWACTSDGCNVTASPSLGPKCACRPLRRRGFKHALVQRRGDPYLHRCNTQTARPCHRSNTTPRQ